MTKSSLLDAWRVIQQKGKAGGIDGVSVQFYTKNFDSNINSLLEKLKAQSYIPEPYQHITSPKEGKPGEYRHLSLPTINDKIVQQALRNLMEPIFNKIFLDTSYAYRANKGPVKSILRISHIINTEKTKWVVCADIDQFFDTMNHKFLIAEIEKKIKEPKILTLISMWLKSGIVTQKGIYKENMTGVAQGSIISPLFSNIYLHSFDTYLAEKECLNVRYADNLILMFQDKSQAEKTFDETLYFLKNVLKLKLNKQNNYISDIDYGFSFMGIFFKNNKRYMERSRIQRTESRIQTLVRTKLIQDQKYFHKKMEERIQGFNNYYSKLVNQEYCNNRFNLFLQQSIIETLLYNFKRKNKSFSKTDVKARLAPIVLFGNQNQAFKNKWITYISDKYSEKLKKSKERINKQSTDPSPPWHDTANSSNTDSDIEKKALKAIKKQKAKYKKLEGVSREVVVRTRGVFIGKNKKNLVVKKKGVKLFDFPLEKLETLNITAKGITISSDIIMYCSDMKVPLFFGDGFGTPSFVLHNPIEGDPDLGLLQLQTLQDRDSALSIATKFIEGKIRNQINLLKYYKRSRANNSLFCTSVSDELNSMANVVKKLKSVKFNTSKDYGSIRNKLMGHEADAAKRYWQLVKILLADDVPDFQGRKRKGAKDLVNSLLNYGYGFLYRQVWNEVVYAGLNPKISFLHAPQGEKPTLVFDLVEEFRPQAVDRVVLSMLTKRERLKVNKKSGMLDDKSRKKVIEALHERQGTAMKYHGEKILLKNIIKKQIRKLCLHLKGKTDYHYFIAYY